jgi:two-component sensor histidine kinase
MTVYFEAHIGKSVAGTPVEMGREAATRALSQKKKFHPSLALAFVSAELDVFEVNRGLMDVLEDCPLMGSSTAGEIADGFLRNSVVVTLLCSPHINVKLGMGKGVSKDYQKAVDYALENAHIAEYFNARFPEHQMLNVSASGTLGVSPVLLMLFTPGATKKTFSMTHDIHTYLRKSSSNRIPIFGGSSGDYFRYGPNYQMINGQVSNDAVALAFLETEVLFGLGMSHGFSPTTKRALVTQASGHMVHQFDNRPAADVYAELLDIPVGQIKDNLPAPPSPLNEHPFGSMDVYGNSLLLVPERILADGSIQFPHLVGNDRVMTLMQADRSEIAKAGVSAYEKAVRYGGLSKPSISIMLSCALRLTDQGEQEEVTRMLNKMSLPLCGFYTFGEVGIFDDGLPVYNNQSVSTLVFSDELNPVASLMHQSKRVYREFSARLDAKESQIRSINRVNRIIQDGTDTGSLLMALTTELPALFPWAHGAFYRPMDNSPLYVLSSALNPTTFPQRISADELKEECHFVGLDSHGKHFGVLALKRKTSESAPEEEDRVLAEIIANLTAGGLHKIELDGSLGMKMNQLEILNQLGYEFSRQINSAVQSQNIVRHVRRILGVSFATLWLVDRTHRLWTKEAVDGDRQIEIGDIETENDERLTKWQIEHSNPLFFFKRSDQICPIDLRAPFPYSFVTVPVIYKEELRAVLNLYATAEKTFLFYPDHISDNIAFLEGISSQVAMFIENRSLSKHSTFYREIHHRVKNNLQNIAALLRMQLRRLDHVSPEQALTDSISRIMSIALVHETLSQGQIGMVDLGRLVGSISKAVETDRTSRPWITLDVSEHPVMIPSREATSVALVVNELIQNALEHGIKKKDDGRVSVKIRQMKNMITVTVQDDGPGFPENFDSEQHGNLGLTIVQTLAGEELKGVFEIRSDHGATAELTFPLPQGYHPMKARRDI